MFTYAKLSSGAFYFKDGSVWSETNPYGPCYQKQRGFVTGAFQLPVQNRLQDGLMTLYSPATDAFNLV
jgi:hypothetical protein